MKDIIMDCDGQAARPAEPKPMGEIVYYPVGEDTPVYHGFGWGGNHKGADYKLPVGTPVKSMRDGKVIESAEDSKTYGRYLMVQHDDGYASLYGHLSKLNKRKGDTVKGGEVIGLSGGAVGAPGAGQTTGAHLHFEVRPPEMINYNWKAIDPVKYIEAHRQPKGGESE